MHGDSQLLHVGDLSPKVDDKLVPSPAPRVGSPKDAEYWHLRGLEKHYKHREHWSWFLLSLISAMVLFQMVVIVLAGVDILDFEDYKWLLPGLMIQNLGQVVGLAIYAVKYLFSDVSERKTGKSKSSRANSS